MAVIFLNMWLVLISFSVFIDFSEEYANFKVEDKDGSVVIGKPFSNYY